MAQAPDPREPLISSYRDDPDMAELVKEFVGELPARMQALEAAWRERQLTHLTRMAHQLKGSCAGYGFPTIGTAAASLEGKLRELGATADEHRLALLASEFRALVDLCARAARPEGSA
jgi:HPt (histidine-containing phosphotransfer) domain-containing protein